MVAEGSGASLLEENYERASDLLKESDDEASQSVDTKEEAPSRRTLTGRVIPNPRDESIDSDIELDGEEEASDLDSEDELELMKLSAKAGDRKRPTTTVKKAADSDDDF